MPRHTDRLRAERDPAARARVRHEAIIEERDRIVGRTIRRRGLTLTVDDIVPGESPAGTPYVTVTVTVTNAKGEDVTPASLNPIKIVNQPIHVTDPAGDLLLGDVRGREDARAALLATLDRVMADRVAD